MKSQIILFTTALSMALALPSTASAAPLLASESFDYADGNLSGQNGGTGFDTAWGDANGNASSITTATVSGGLLTSTGTIFRGLTNEFGASGSVWMQFDYRTNALIGFSGIQLFNGTSEVALIGGRANETWQMSGGAGDVITSPVDSTVLKTGVLKLDITAGEISVWVGDVGTTIATSGTADLFDDGFVLAGVDTIRIGSAQSQSIDNFEYAANASDLTAIPEPGTYAMLLGLSGFVLVIARRRRIA